MGAARSGAALTVSCIPITKASAPTLPPRFTQIGEDVLQERDVGLCGKHFKQRKLFLAFLKCHAEAFHKTTPPEQPPQNIKVCVCVCVCMCGVCVSVACV